MCEYICIITYIFRILASVSSPIVTAGMRNLHENKVSSQLSGNSANHHADNSRHGSNEDYLQMVHRLSSDVCYLNQSIMINQCIMIKQIFTMIKQVYV